MNITEEQTAAELRSLAQAAAPATAAAPDLARQVLARAERAPARPHRRRVRAGAGALGLLTVAGVVAAAGLTGGADYREWTQPSGSMVPTVAVSQTVLVGKDLAPQRGDVVLIEATDGTLTFETLRRVVGLPGDTVACPVEADGTCDAVVVSGEALQEPWLAVPTEPFAEAAVPAGHVFLLGDARDAAVDSRLTGPQRLDSVLGVVVARFTDDGRREALPGTPPHEIPGGGSPIEPADPVPPAPATG